jgi:CRP-like cAMP-binding protein/small-conductance mechanosensitive channel
LRTVVLNAVLVFVAIVVVAALVNRYRRAHRHQVRRLVILFAAFLIAHAARQLLLISGDEVWAARVAIGADLLEAFTIVNIAATAIFALTLPAVGLALPMIAGDLFVGAAYLVMTLGVLAAHHIEAPTSFVASAAVVSAALVISLQSTLGNVLGGIALQLDGSLHEGDWIELENPKRQGLVRAIRWRHSVVETRDGSTVIVPNAQLLANSITILGKRDGKSHPHRMWVWFNVDFRYTPTKVIDTVVSALKSAPIPNVAIHPTPSCVCMDFTRERRESFATYAVRFWLTDLAVDDPTASLVRARIFTALRRAGIPFAIPAERMWVEVEDASRLERRAQRDLDRRWETLRTLPLFRALRDEETQQLALGLSHVIYTKDEVITRQGAVAHWLYILTAGEVEIRTVIDGSPHGRVVAKLTAPDVFGEMGLMTGAPRTADVVALTDVECYRLDKETFERVLLERPEIAKELSERLAQRRLELFTVKDDLDDSQRKQRQSMEQEQILGAIRSFFSL